MIFRFKNICGRPDYFRLCFQIIITIGLQKTLPVTLAVSQAGKLFAIAATE